MRPADRDNYKLQYDEFPRHKGRDKTLINYRRLTQGSQLARLKVGKQYQHGGQNGITVAVLCGRPPRLGVQPLITRRGPSNRCLQQV